MNFSASNLGHGLFRVQGRDEVCPPPGGYLVPSQTGAGPCTLYIGLVRGSIRVEVASQAWDEAIPEKLMHGGNPYVSKPIAEGR